MNNQQETNDWDITFVGYKIPNEINEEKNNLLFLSQLNFDFLFIFLFISYTILVFYY